MRRLPCGLELEDGPVLVTGAAGFVGGVLMDRLGMGEGDMATDVTDDFPAPAGVRRMAWSLPSEAPDGIGEFRYLVHLAAVSSVSRSVREVQRTWETNLMGTVSVLQTMARRSPEARLLLVSSAEVYRPVRRPVDEDAALGPINPYGATKAAAEIAAGQMARGTGLDVVVARSFPHFGPGQDPGFALPSFCRRVAETAAGGGGSVRAGNLRPVRDYLYVEDVARAYCHLLARGESRRTYNVCSGEGHSMAEILELLVEISGADISVRVDPDLRRAVDTEYQVGDPARLRDRLGWRRRFGLQEGLRKLYTWWEERI